MVEMQKTDIFIKWLKRLRDPWRGRILTGELTGLPGEIPGM
jgi:hypothetical protein